MLTFSILLCSYKLIFHPISGEGPVAQWIRHLTTDQGIPGSSPGRVVFYQSFFFFFPSLFFALQLLLLHTYQDTCPSLFKIRKKLKWIKSPIAVAKKRVTSRAVFESFLGYEELKLTTKRATKLLAGCAFRSLLIYHKLYLWVHPGGSTCKIHVFSDVFSLRSSGMCRKQNGHNSIDFFPPLF